MTTQCFSLVRGRVMRVTKLDNCGRPVQSACSTVVSDGFVSVAFTANTEEGETISVTNAAGKVCVRDAACPSFTGYTVELTFCEVDPDLLALVTNQNSVYNQKTMDAVGFRMNSDISGCDAGFALEIWSNVPGVACDPDNPNAQGAFGYLLVPFLQGGVLGDFTIENDAVSFVVSGAATKTGSGWGTGPYDVVGDETGAAGKLAEPIDKGDHVHIEVTEVAPPDPTCGCVALGNPATGATSGTPGTWTPTDSVAPRTLNDLVNASPAITASPTTAWQANEYVVLGDNSQATWSGTAWIAHGGVTGLSVQAQSSESDPSTVEAQATQQ